MIYFFLKLEKKISIYLFLYKSEKELLMIRPDNNNNKRTSLALIQPVRKSRSLDRSIEFVFILISNVSKVIRDD